MCSNSPKNGAKEAIKLVQDITKQILTLTTGILALSATFIKILIPDAPRLIAILFFAWFLFTVSIIGGLFTLSSIVHKLEKEEYEPFAKCTEIPARVQWICFIVGFVLLWIFVTFNLN